MIVIGFGFLMTFLKRYGFSAVSVNLLLTAVTGQLFILIDGVVRGALEGHFVIKLNLHR